MTLNLSCLGCLGLVAWPELVSFGQPRNKSANLTNLKITESQAKIQQTKMLVTCPRFGDLFLFWLVSSEKI